MTSKNTRPPEEKCQNAPGTGQAAFNEPKTEEDKMNAIHQNTTTKKAPGSLPMGDGSHCQTPLLNSDMTDIERKFIWALNRISEEDQKVILAYIEETVAGNVSSEDFNADATGSNPIASMRKRLGLTQPTNQAGQ